MPNNKQLVGQASPFGMSAARITWTGSDGVSMAGVVAQILSQNIRDNIAVADLKDGDMNTIGRAGHDQTHEASVEVILYASTPGTEAASRLLVNLPQKMSIVTISGVLAGATSRTPQLMDGDFNYLGGTIDGRQGDYWRLTFNLWRGGVGTNPAALSLVS